MLQLASPALSQPGRDNWLALPPLRRSGRGPRFNRRLRAPPCTTGEGPRGASEVDQTSKLHLLKHRLVMRAVIMATRSYRNAIQLLERLTSRLLLQTMETLNLCITYFCRHFKNYSDMYMSRLGISVTAW